MFVLLVTQGFMQIFFGYVENYSIAAAAGVVFLIVGERASRGVAPLWSATLCLALALYAHLMPAWGYLFMRSCRAARTSSLARWDTGSALVVWPVLAAAYNGATGGRVLVASSRVLSDVLQPLSQQLGNGGFWESHIDRYIQGQLLVGPVSGGLFLILAILALPRLGTFPAWLRFLLLAGLGAWAGGLLAGDSNLGYARNWDLQAPLAIIVAIAIVALLARLILPKARRGVLLVLVVVSILHTLPWILLNADEATALQPRAL